MFEYISKKIIKRFLKNPCDKCLVKACCINKFGTITKTCDVYNKYKGTKMNLELVGLDIDAWIATLIIILTLLFFAATFFLGIWKWIDIIKYFLVK